MKSLSRECYSATFSLSFKIKYPVCLPFKFISAISPCLFPQIRISAAHIYPYDEFLQVPTNANAVMSGKHGPADSVIEPSLQSSVNNRGDFRELGVAAFGIKPGGMLYGNWPPLNQRQNTYKTTARKESDSSGSFDVSQNTGEPSQDGVSARPGGSRVVIGGTQVQAAEKRRFRMSQEFKIQQRISDGISPLTRPTSSGTSLSTLSRNASGKSLDPGGMRDYFGDYSRYKMVSHDTESSSRSQNTPGVQSSKLSGHEMDSNHPVVQQTRGTSPAGKPDLIVRKVETPIHVPPPKRLNMPSFIDLLDTAIGNYDPYKQMLEGRISPPPGILNAPYGMGGLADEPGDNNPSYDSDWAERLFDPVPGAGVYIGEIRDTRCMPKDWNVVYISLDINGDAVVRALPSNRRGQKIPLKQAGEVKRRDIELRSGFGNHWTRNEGEDDALAEIKKLAKARLERKAELDNQVELRFAEDVKCFWKLRNFGRD